MSLPARLLSVVGLLAMPVWPALAADEPAPSARRVALDFPGGDFPLYVHAPEGPTAVRALVLVHGQGRDLWPTLATALEATSAQRADTLVAAPLFPVAAAAAASCSSADTPRAGVDELTWACKAWSAGEAAEGGGPGAFDVIDQALAKLATDWPGLRQITLAGFSAGAQFVQRYAAFGHPPPGVALRYLVASPGTWLYFDAQRPLPPDGDWAACASSGTPECAFSWAVPGACEAASRWKYGLQDLPAGLADGAADARERYRRADIVYLLGGQDTGQGRRAFYRILDKSCAAMAQGPYRLQRGLAYAAYDRLFLKPPQARPPHVVEGCAHDARCVFGSATARALLFPVTPPAGP